MIFRQFDFDGCLSYVVGCERGLVGAVIDPSSNSDVYIDYVRRKHLKVVYVIETHTHSDHFSSAAGLASELGAKTVMSSEVTKQRMVSTCCGDFYGLGNFFYKNSQMTVNLYLEDGDKLNIGSILMEAIHTPGHTLDSISLLTNDRVFTGDTLLAGQCGRTDLPGGNPDAMYDSIFEKLLKLPDDLLVFPAHDYSGNAKTTIGYERRNNSFIKNMMVSETINLSQNERTIPVRENNSVHKVV